MILFITHTSDFHFLASRTEVRHLNPVRDSQESHYPTSANPNTFYVNLSCRQRRKMPSYNDMESRGAFLTSLKLDYGYMGVLPPFEINCIQKWRENRIQHTRESKHLYPKLDHHNHILGFRQLSWKMNECKHHLPSVSKCKLRCVLTRFT